MARGGNIHIGTSGWHYGHWKGVFYPEDMDEGRMLLYYGERFAAVEINNSFYQLPSKKTLKEWSGTVGGDFVFAVKASRYITHMKKLKDPKDSLAKFVKVVDILGYKSGPVLFQLPPKWHVNAERLRAFLEAVPEKWRCTFEFRDESWFCEDVYELLRERNAAFCIYELGGRMSPEEVTADFVYIRLHGPAESAYAGSYSKQKLRSWAKKLDKWAKEGKDCWCFFDNDQEGYAATNALTLQEMVK